MKKRLKQAAGFTLVELIVVIAILGILAGVAVPTYSGYVTKANQAADEQLLMAVNTAFASACIDEGEFDTKNLSVRPQATIEEDGSVTMETEKYADAFNRYFANSGVFKYFDVLGFDAAQGRFVGSTIAALKEALAGAWDGSGFEDIDLDTILKQFDDIGDLFSGFSWTALEAFPESIRNALGLGGLSDVTNEDAEAYLSKLYGDDWDSMSEEEKAALIANYKGNAGTMQILAAAGAYSAEEIVENIGDFVMVMGSYDETDSEFKSGLIAYYNTLNGYEAGDEGYTTDYETAKSRLSVPNMLSGDQVYALANSNMANSSGAGTLGAMYALAMAYYGGEEGHNYGHFDAFTDAMKSEGFLEYMGISVDVDAGGNFSVNTDYTNSQAMKDIEAYQSFAQYLSAGDINMADTDAFAKLLTYMAGALS